MKTADMTLSGLFLCLANTPASSAEGGLPTVV